MNGYCKATGKDCFSTRALAEKVAKQFSSRRGKKKCAVYRCGYCHKYHLTSMRYNSSKEVREIAKKYGRKYVNLYD